MSLSCTHVLLHTNTFHKPFQHLYSGSYRILKHADKPSFTFTITIPVTMEKLNDTAIGWYAVVTTLLQSRRYKLHQECGPTTVG